MKRVLLVASILLISVVSTACINSFAVQELNTKAKSFIENGDYQSAVERLKSSIDLDSSAYESYYNLAVAYTKLDDYINAFENYKKVIELKPDFADGYYSLAVCEENLITDLEAGTLLADENGNLSKPEEIETEHTIDDNSKAYVKTLTADAVANYENYLSKAENPQDKANVEERIAELNSKAVEE